MKRHARSIFIGIALLGIATGMAGVFSDSRLLIVASLAFFSASVAFGLASRSLLRRDTAAVTSGSVRVKSGRSVEAARNTEVRTIPVRPAPEVRQPAVQASTTSTITASDPMTTEFAHDVPLLSATSPAPAAVPAPDDTADAPPVPEQTEGNASSSAEQSTDAEFDTMRVPVSVEPPDVLAALQSSASSAGEVLSAHLWLEDESSGTLRLIAAAGVFRPAGDPEPLAGTCLGRALSSGVAAWCPEMARATPDGETTVWRYAVPLSSGDARGVVALDVAGDDPDLAILTRAAAMLRSALTGALALHVAREQTRASNTLLEATRELSRLIDPDEVVRALLRRAMSLSSAQTGSVMLLGEDGRLSIAVSEGLPDEVPIVTSMAEGEGIAGWVLATGQPVVVEDLECKGPRSRRHGIRSAVSVPIADDDGIVGVLNVGNRTFRARFSSSHRDALETLGRMGAMALRNARALKASQALYFDTLKALAVALETKDPYARGATDRVEELACALSEALGMSEKERTAVRIAALLHDVGMTAAGDVINVTDRPLSTVEWGMVKVHPVIAADVLEQAPALREAIPIVYHHHERFDGDGYVVGLAADTIPLGARVLSVADAYVAMTSDRSYRPAMSPSAALREMRQNAGTQFDPDVVTALERHIDSPTKRPSVD